MPATTLRQGLKLIFILPAMLMMLMTTPAPAIAGEDLEIGSSSSETTEKNALLGEEGEDDEDIVSVGPSSHECGETVENSRC